MGLNVPSATGALSKVVRVLKNPAVLGTLTGLLVSRGVIELLDRKKDDVVLLDGTGFIDIVEED